METEATYVPPEVVLSQILPRLPVRSLLRFRCVCKAWRDTIDDEDSFHREHLRHQEASLLLAPQVRHNRVWSAHWGEEVVTTTGLYRWERNEGAAKLVHGMADYHKFWETEAAHDLAHYDGLVLLPSEATVRVVNPATRPARPHASVEPPQHPWSHGGRGRLQSHQEFSLGHDPRSNAYKVARFFYCTVDTGAYHYTVGMEIFTVGTNQNWRDIKPGQTATFCKGSLIWTIEQSLLKDNNSLSGFVRLKLEDKSFSVVPPPPCYDLTWKIRAVSHLAELRGEFCLVHSGLGYMSLDIWMCNHLDVDNLPRWDRRHVIALERPMYAQLVCPKAMFDDEIVSKYGYNLLRYNYQTGETRECPEGYG